MTCLSYFNSNPSTGSKFLISALPCIMASLLLVGSGLKKSPLNVGDPFSKSILNTT